MAGTRDWFSWGRIEVNKSGKHKTWKLKSGSHITQADARAIAEEFENSEVDYSSVDVLFPRRAGRPSLTGQSEESPQVSFRVSQDVREKAQREAAKQRTTVSALAREALESYLRKAG